MKQKLTRLELKPIAPADRDTLTELLTDETVGRTYMVPDFPTRQAAETLAERLCAISAQENRYVAGIYLQENLIGLLNETETGDDWIELGYAILPRYHGCGYGTEALTGAIDWLFDHGFGAVLTAAFEDNVASLRVMEKSGMTRLERQEDVEYRGKMYRCVYYSARKFG